MFLVTEQYLPFAVVEAPAFRSMIRTLNDKASSLDRKGVIRKMSAMRAVMEEDMLLMIRDEWVARTNDS